MSKLIMMRGLPGTGKTTQAEEIVRRDGNFVRLNRDLLREMLHFNRWTPNNERVTKRTQSVIAEELLKLDHNVILDDTNLGESHRERWKNIAHATNSKFEVVDMNEGLDIDEIIHRDSQREKMVGADVIMQMALQYELVDTPPKPFVVCDIDGTIADVSHRLPYVHKDPKDWKGFFNAMGEDAPRTEVIQLLEEYWEEGHDIILVTARPEDYREKTSQWVREYMDEEMILTIIMRKSGDKRPDTEVKEQMYNKYLKHYPIEVVIDDRPAVIRMWESKGLPVKDVGQGIEF